MRHTAAAAAITAGLIALAGCSSGVNRPSAGGSPTGPAPGSAAPTGPNPALCAAARTLVAGMQATFAADANGPDDKQAADASAFYTQLTLVFSENGGSDPLSVAVAQDAERLSTDYIQLQGAQQAHDLDKQNAALTALTSDLDRMVADQGPFDAACGIPQIVPS